MTDMVEKVGAAIQAAFPTIGFKKHALDQGARAAIEAMRDPDAAMLKAADGLYMKLRGFPTSREVWQAMVDEALAKVEG